VSERAWLRYAVVVAAAIWALSLIPAFVFLPHYRNHEGRQVSYALYWMFAPLFVAVTFFLGCAVRITWPQFSAWLTGSEKRSLPRHSEYPSYMDGNLAYLREKYAVGFITLAELEEGLDSVLRGGPINVPKARKG